MNSKNKFNLFMIFVIISIIIAVVSAYFGLNLPYLKNFISLNHNLAALIYTILFIILAALSFSISVVTSLGVLAFSTKELMVYAMIGVMGGAIIHYYIAKKLGRDYVRNYLEQKHGKIEKFDEIVEKNTFKTIVVLSAIYFVPPTIPNLLGGIIKINFRRFCIATFLGNLPNTVLTIFLVSGFLTSNTVEIYICIAGLVATSLIALYFYTGEIKNILRIGFPWAFTKTGREKMIEKVENKAIKVEKEAVKGVKTFEKSLE